MSVKQELLKLEDFSSICRTCLNRENLMSLAKTNYLELIKYLTKTENDVEEILPCNICNQCIKKLEDISSFIALSQNTHRILKQVLEEKPQLAFESVEEQLLENEHFTDSETEVLETKFEDTETFIKQELSQPEKNKTISTKWKPTICEICTKSFSSKKKFVAHARQNPKCRVKNYKCTVCEKSFLTDSKLKYHMRCHSGETAFKCEICLKTFGYAANLRRHDNVVHKGLKPYKCEICGKDFSRLVAKTEHMSRHTGKRPFTCHFCNENFHYYSQYFSHLYVHRLYREEITNASLKVTEYENSKISSVECTICFKKISPLSIFHHSHVTVNRGDIMPRDKDFLCTICGKSFLRKLQLDSHSLVHTDLKPYACDKCDKTFRHYSTWKTHLMVHDGVKPFNCKTCGCKFTQRQHLKQHVRTHTGEKPFLCNFCGKNFAAKSNLIVHVRLHTGETPYKCDICDKGFCDSSSMKKHMRSHNIVFIRSDGNRSDL